MRPRTPTFDRVKLTLGLTLYAGMAEWQDPRPFASSSWAKIIYFWIVIEIFRQVWTWGLERSTGHVARNQILRDRWDARKEQIDSNLRYRIRRMIILFASVYIYGWFVSGMTTKCDGALQCAVGSTRMMVENLPEMIKFALYMAIGLSQLGLMFYAMTRVGGPTVVAPGSIDVTFDDVYGQDKAKSRVVEQIALLEDGEAVEAAGGYMPRGLLLWGPPGTGKTMLAKAAANAMTRPLIMVPPNMFQSTFVGIAPLKVWSLFRLIRKLSLRHGGVVVFFDEIDTLGNRGAQVTDQWSCTPSLTDELTLDDSDRTHHTAPPRMLAAVDRIMMTGGGANQGALESLLAAMDGMDVPRGLINKLLKILGFRAMPPPVYRWMIMGATNLPDKLDPALTRDGRLELKIHVGYPDFDGRMQTLKGYMGKVEHSLTEDQVTEMCRDLHRGTGASIRRAVNEALLAAFRDGREVFTAQDMLNGLLWSEFGESIGRQEVDEDSWKVAVHEAGHAVASLALLPDYYRIRFGTIEKRGQVLGMIAYSDIADRPVRGRDVSLRRVAVSMASAAAEQQEFGESTTGVSGDLQAATAQARAMTRRWGMGDSWQVHGEGMHGDQYDKAVESILAEAWTVAENVVADNEAALHRVAELLNREGTVLGVDIVEAFDGP